MSDDWRCALLRLRAAHFRHLAAVADFQSAALRATKSMRAFGDSLAALERQEFEQHPDVQEVVATMRGFYCD